MPSRPRYLNPMTPAETLILLQEGASLHRQGKLAAAAERYEQVLREEPATPTRCNSSAPRHSRRSATRRAALAGQRRRRPAARRHAPRRRHGPQGTGQFEDALSSFERAAEIEPASAQFLVSRANALSELGRFDAAPAPTRRSWRSRPTWRKPGSIKATADAVAPPAGGAREHRAGAGATAEVPALQLQRANCLRALGRNETRSPATTGC